jgi:spermidine/putrescine transport system substrate-binding protein
VLHLYNWNNYISAQTIERFEASCACRVVQDYYSDNEEMRAKLAVGASGYDLIVPTGNAAESLIRQGALRPVASLHQFHAGWPQLCRHQQSDRLRKSKP